MGSFIKQYAFIFITLFSSFVLANSNNTGLSYVGSQVCQNCHQTEYEKWQGSHQDMAMRHASPESVIGNFDNATVEFEGKTNRFFTKGSKQKPEYWLNIKGVDGAYHDYQIKYTFGFEPLQQYMVEFDDGRVQLIPFAWDARPKENGGQRWFHLYTYATDSKHPFFWTNTWQNWNYMCADCHSTNLKKNFDLATNTFNTTYSEINVGCEACHGATSEHITWAEVKIVQKLKMAL